jgi:hypothetical protein
MEKTPKEDKLIWRMRQEYLIQNHLTELDRMAKKPSHATVPLRGSQLLYATQIVRG